MKKIIVLFLCFVFCASLCFGENAVKKGTAGRPQHRNRSFMDMQNFGLKPEQYTSLGLSKKQTEKANSIKMKYRDKFTKGKGGKPADMINNLANINKEFRGILTETQKKKYDKFLTENTKPARERIRKMYTDNAVKLGFTADQKKKLNQNLNKYITIYSIDFFNMEKSFTSIMSAAQKKKYEEIKKANMPKGNARRGKGGRLPHRK
ncbi:MAG: hypothetical protein KBT47_05675 [Armatimonadetes bacterium]|nr:hypothetical protein [Candidatus Hippobium faecium]